MLYARDVSGRVEGCNSTSPTLDAILRREPTREAGGMIRIAGTVFMVSLVAGACAVAPQNSPSATAGPSGETPSMKPAEREAVSALKWLDAADPIADARRAIAEKRPVLLTLGGRGAPTPGISADERARLETKCPTRVLPGATDVVRGDTHFDYLKRARQYAEQYNREVAAHCAP
jgi:hypothetical protein